MQVKVFVEPLSPLAIGKLILGLDQHLARTTIMLGPALLPCCNSL
jgi:hypothetical protein